MSTEPPSSSAGRPEDEDRGPYFSEVSPDERSAEERTRVNPGGVVGGVVVGFLGSVAVPFVMALVVQTPLALWLAVALLAVVGVAALSMPRWRRIGAGFVMGLAIGSIVFAGLCAAFLFSLNAQLSPGG